MSQRFYDYSSTAARLLGFGIRPREFNARTCTTHCNSSMVIFEHIRTAIYGSQRR